MIKQTDTLADAVNDVWIPANGRKLVLERFRITWDNANTDEDGGVTYLTLTTDVRDDNEEEPLFVDTVSLPVITEPGIGNLYSSGVIETGESLARNEKLILKISSTMTGGGFRVFAVGEERA